MEGLAYIIQRFFVSFLAGSVINLYVIIYYIALKSTNVLPQIDVIKFIPLNYSNFTFIFVISAIIIGTIIEGIDLAGKTAYRESNKKQKKRTEKPIYTLICALKKLFILFELPSMRQVCKKIIKRDELDENPINDFIKDAEIPSETCDDIYDAVRMCAKHIRKDGRASQLFIYREMGYIMQMLMVSFIGIGFISGITLLMMITSNILNTGDVDSFKMFANISLIMSTVLTILAIQITRCCGKRYINAVGTSYRTIELEPLIKKQDIPNKDLKDTKEHFVVREHT